MSRRGQLWMVGVMMAIIMFIVVVSLIPLLKSQISVSRDSEHLDCTNTSISPGTTATCIVTDWYLFGFVGVAFAVGLGLIATKRLEQVQ